MDAEIKRLIDDAAEKNINGEYVDRETLIAFLNLDPRSEECEYLGHAARRVAEVTNRNMARVGTSIGIDLAPCTMNCRFCSLGEQWGVFGEPYVMDKDEIVRMIRSVRDRGFFQFTLRTTEFYSIDDLCDLARYVRKEVPGVYGLNVNTGELTVEEANRLHDAGFTGAYHTVRLGEGRDTPFDPQTRIETMRNISESKLNLSCGLDPIGLEHTAEEIVDRLLLFRTMNVSSVCTMRRVNVKGTPFEGVPEIDDDRLAQCAAVVRMAGGGKWFVPVQPATPKAFAYGANLTAVEYGAVPRMNEGCFGRWTPVDHDTAVRMMTEAGYDMGHPEDFLKRFS